MGVPIAIFGLLPTVVTGVQQFVRVFFDVYLLLVFAYVLTSWVRLPYRFSPFQRFLYDVVDPYLRLFRRFLPSVGRIDLSPAVGIFVLYGIERGINSLLDRLR